MRSRVLRLVKETLSPLTGGEMNRVVGGASATNTVCVECLPTTDPACPTRQVQCLNDITFELCPTTPIEDCLG